MTKVKKKKKFFEVELGVLGKKISLIAYELQELNGKIIKYDLSRMLKGKNTILSLRVEVKKEKANSYPFKIQVMQPFLKRVMRKRVSYVEDSFSAQCEDAELKIKPFIIARKKVSRAVRKALREKAKQEIIDYIKDKNYERLFKELIKNQIQKSLSLKLKKIYPLSFCEIRVLKVEKLLKNNQD